MILDTISNAAAYAGLGPGIARGLELLASGKLDGLGEGKHELDGLALYASVQEYTPKAPEACRWEAHRNYVDIQYLVAGRETMGYCPQANLRVSDPYDSGKDVVFFSGGPELGTILNVDAKMFAIFFPEDAHRPMMAWGANPGTVKKIVLKVAVKLNFR